MDIEIRLMPCQFIPIHEHMNVDSVLFDIYGCNHSAYRLGWKQKQRQQQQKYMQHINGSSGTHTHTLSFAHTLLNRIIVFVVLIFGGDHSPPHTHQISSIRLNTSLCFFSHGHCHRLAFLCRTQLSCYTYLYAAVIKLTNQK